MGVSKGKIAAIVGGVIGTGFGIYFGMRAAAAPEVPPEVPPTVEPDIEMVSASWDKDTYEPGELATLSVILRNPTPWDLTYQAIARGGWDNTYVVHFEQSFALAAGQKKTITFSGNAPSEEGAYFIYLDCYYEDQLFDSIRMPDLVVAPTAVGAQFVMLGGLNNERLWALGQNAYTKTGKLKNIGDEGGTTKVVGWFTVGNYGAIHDIHEEEVILGPGESKDISFAITREQMELAEQEAGYPIYGYYEYLLVYISVADHITYGKEYGWLFTSDIVHIQT